MGLVTGACFADLGHAVAVRDVVPDKIDALRAGQLPIYEPGLGVLVERNADRLCFTTDVREAIDDAEFVYIAQHSLPSAHLAISEPSLWGQQTDAFLKTLETAGR